MTPLTDKNDQGKPRSKKSSDPLLMLADAYVLVLMSKRRDPKLLDDEPHLGLTGVALVI